MKRSILLSTVAFAAHIALPAFAQYDPDPTRLDEVVVTATRLPAIVADTPGARVIDQATIERRGAIFAADILSDIPGLSLTRTGAYAGASQVRMRGAAPGKTLVLVDGVPVNDPAEINGAFDFSGFELAEVSRIEVLSGPQSSLRCTKRITNRPASAAVSSIEAASVWAKGRGWASLSSLRSSACTAMPI